MSRRIHSRYDRTLADAAIGNRPSHLVLRVRRFLCLSTECGRRTFAEQIDGLTSAYARRIPLLTGVLERIGLALAGRAGARLAARVGRAPWAVPPCCGWSEHCRTRRRTLSRCSASMTSRYGADTGTALCWST